MRLGAPGYGGKLPYLFKRGYQNPPLVLIPKASAGRFGQLDLIQPFISYFSFHFISYLSVIYQDKLIEICVRLMQ